MQVKEIAIGIPLLLFVLWIFTAPFPQERIARSCEPVNWLGNIATSVTALGANDSTETSARWSDKLNYSCRYMIWRLIYQDSYNQAVKEQRIIPSASHEQINTQEAELTTPTPASEPEKK